MKRKIVFFIAIFILVSAFGCSKKTETTTIQYGQTDIGNGLSDQTPLFIGNQETTTLNISFIEMNYLYGDSIYINMGDIDILIDGGQPEDGPYIDRFIAENVQDKRLDLLVTTHAHADHIGGIVEAVQSIENISMIIDFGYKRNSGEGYLEYRDMRDKYQAKGAKYCSTYDSINKLNNCQNEYYISKDLKVEVLDTGYYRPTDEVWTSDPNLTSSVTLFKYKDFSFFTGGDLPENGEKSLVRKGALSEVTLFKSTHHGTNGGNTLDFLKKLNPKAVAISAARAGRYGTKPDPKETFNLNGAQGHPFKEAIANFYLLDYIKENKNVYWNMPNGTMTFSTDGRNDIMSFKGSETKRGYYEIKDNNYVWDELLGRYQGKVTGEENLRLHETKIFKIRGYDQIVTI